MQDQRAGFWARTWRGEERLWKVWWLVGVPLAGAGAVFNAAASEKLIARYALPVLAFSVALLVAYIAWCGMAWRCAPNVDTKIWTPIARIAIVLGLLRTTAEILKVFQHSPQPP
jgi:predicted outer membrane lipoprotein